MEGDPYRRLGHRELYRNRWLAVEAHEIVHPSGAPGEHVLIIGARPVGVVVLDGSDVILTLQPRFAARRSMIEIVKGGADEGEAAVDGARRELEEELGIRAAVWHSLGLAYELPSLMEAPIELFLARELSRTQTALEETETIAERRLHFAQAVHLALEGGLDDAVTAIALLRAGHLLATESQAR